MMYSSEQIKNFIGRISGKSAHTCVLIHDAGNFLITDKIVDRNNSGAWSECESEPCLSVDHFGQGIILAGFTGKILPPDGYLGITGALAEIGVKKIELYTWGWFLLREPKMRSPAIRITDHIACRLPGPLTGTDSARRGDGFIDMHGAYCRDFETVYSQRGDESINIEGILWHTSETERISEEEVEMAEESGCVVASPNVAPWATGAKAAGIRFAATVFAIFRAGDNAG